MSCSSRIAGTAVPHLCLRAHCPGCRRPQEKEVGGAKGREKSGTERASADREKAYKEQPKMVLPELGPGSRM